MDGYVTIGTKLDTKELEKELKSAEADLRRYDSEARRLTNQQAKLEIDLEPYKKAKQEIQAETNKLLRETVDIPRKETLAGGHFYSLSGIQTAENKIIGEEQSALEKLDGEYKTLLNRQRTLNELTKQNVENRQKAVEKAKELSSELSSRKTTDTMKQGFSSINSSLDGIKNKMQGIVHTAIKWGLAVFGIRSTYMFIRRSISTISQYDTQLASNIEYIKWALAMTLKPVVEYIVKLAYKLLGLLRAIIKVLFHYDIFANASAEAFKKAKQSTSGIDNNLGKSVKKAKELNKQLASFDEMNILGDNTKEAGDTGTTGGVSGSDFVMPFEIPDISANIDWEKIWNNIKDGVDWLISKLKFAIKDFFDYIGNKWIEKGEELGGVLGEWSKLIGNWLKNVGEFIGTAIDGIARIFGGLGEIIKGIFSGDIERVLKGLVDVILGLFESMVASAGLILNGLVAVLKAPFVATIEIVKETVADIKNRFKSLKDWFGKLEISVKWSKLKSGLSDTVKAIKDKLKDLGTKVGSSVSNAFKTVFNKMIDQVQKVINKPIKAINGIIDAVNKLLPKGKRMSKLSTISLPKLAKGGIVNLPSSGVPVGGAIAGESGREGVIPLTDSQQMALLGEAIGKYITINANITNSMNGRVISRELQKIQNDNNFAYNR